MSNTEKKKKGGLKAFIWDSERKEFLGRTGSGWAKLTLFYIIFFGCLAGIFLGSIQAMLVTLSNYKPTYQDRIVPLGLSHTPRLETSEIAFSMMDTGSFTKYTESMANLLKMYDDDLQKDGMKYENCGPGPRSYKDRGNLESNQGQRKACRFKRSWLGPCSGKTDPTYGFRDGKPCLIVKLNRIVNFKPQAPSRDSIPEPLKSNFNPNLIPIFCKNKREEDQNKIGEIKYHGIEGGFPLQYYPYYGKLLHPQYLQPLVAVQFMNLTRGEELRIECKVFGANINYCEKDRYQGRFNIKFTINNS
ncbi:sodium/potassium-transporting ATPase subunit beta-1-like [Eucyclogobius newberryi]|uniref:sodium/potassium-transporting ATPase subunit beta-1-like n=1 Tax=Eucyclogobius newberryi TaxID=166745 RepID=UPI003B592DE5